MNERFLSKAKRLDNKQLVIGNFVRYSETKGYIYGDYIDKNEIWEIDPKTLCACTGIEDFLKTLVFENDKLYKDGTYFGYVRFNIRYLKFEIVLANKKHGKTTALAHNIACLTVIGNIHDKED